MSADWMISPRDDDLGRTLDPVAGWTDLTLVERNNTPGTWTLSGPAAALDSFEPGMGCILDRDGEQIESGVLRSYDRDGAVDMDTGRVTDTITLGFVGDDDVFGGRLAWQDPTKALASTLSKFAAEHDVRTGTRETLILEYLAANVGPAAPRPNRRVADLVLPATLGRGGSTRFTARMNELAVVVHDLAEAAGLRVRVVHDESTGSPRLLVTIEPTDDVSAHVRFGPPFMPASALISSWKFAFERPRATRAIAAAGGEGVDRLYAQQIDAAAESLWKTVREVAVDQRQTSEQDEVDDKLAETLAEGAGPTSVAFTVADSDDVQYRRDYRVGSRVGLDLPGLPAAMSSDVVREVTTKVSAAAGQAREQVSVVIGSAGATAVSTASTKHMTTALRAIRALERSR